MKEDYEWDQLCVDMSVTPTLDEEFEDSAKVLYDKHDLRPDLRDDEVVTTEGTSYEISKCYLGVTAENFSADMTPVDGDHVTPAIAKIVLHAAKSEFGEEKRFIIAKPKAEKAYVKLKMITKFSTKKTTFVLPKGQNARVGLSDLILKNERKHLRKSMPSSMRGYGTNIAAPTIGTIRERAVTAAGTLPQDKLCVALRNSPTALQDEDTPSSDQLALQDDDGIMVDPDPALMVGPATPGSAPRRRRMKAKGSPEQLELEDGTCSVRSKSDPRRVLVETPPSVKKKFKNDDGNEADFVTLNKQEEEMDYIKIIEGSAQKGDRRYLEHQYSQD